MCTGYPVMVVVVVVMVVITAQAATDPVLRIDELMMFVTAASIIRIEIMK
jgi:hypothetical protein